MCGIVGYVGPREAVPVILEALRHLEYRGYDSAGVAVHTGDALAVLRAPGKLANLVEKAYTAGLHGHLAIGHTRWATHGAPVERNAHPHTDSSGRVAVVHNGIVENFRSLRTGLEQAGVTFSSDTDSEVVAHLLARQNAATLTEAVLAVRGRLEGQYAIAAIDRDDGGTVVAVRNGPPLVVGLGDEENMVASDPSAVVSWTRRCIHLEDGDVATVRRHGVEIVDAEGRRVDRPVVTLDWEPGQVERGGYRHFMLKEIHEQPGAVSETVQALLPHGAGVSLAHLGLDPRRLEAVDNVRLVACGTSWHAALVGKFYLERLARVPCEVDYASEFRYREPILSPRSLVVGITQSGETADTIAAMRLARESGAWLASVCNVRGSLAERLADVGLPTHAGPEIGVASTKAFTTQLAALLALALAFRSARGLDPAETEALADRARSLPYDLEAMLGQAPLVDGVAAALEHATNALYLGRGVLYPLALEGALKLKEISYLHAEGYPAGEMKHGPIALLDENFPVIALAAGGELIDKVASNIQEVRARKAPVYVIGDRDDERLVAVADRLVPLPRVPWPLLPLVAAVPLQLLAYEVAVRRGCDVDQPRNLAKSVTVE